jgi:hypothetical protein
MNNTETNPIIVFKVFIAVCIAGLIGATALWFLFFEFIKFLLKIKLWEWF